jgi:hypothetical protein
MSISRAQNLISGSSTPSEINVRPYRNNQFCLIILQYECRCCHIDLKRLTKIVFALQACIHDLVCLNNEKWSIEDIRILVQLIEHAEASENTTKLVRLPITLKFRFPQTRTLYLLFYTIVDQIAGEWSSPKRDLIGSSLVDSEA